MNTITARSPTRVDLAGGTLDLWPLYNFIGGAKTINVAIDIFTTAVIEPLETAEIELHSEDLKFERRFKNLQACLQDKDPILNLLKVQLNYWQPSQGFRLTTRSESPVGGGLGGSSSLTISLMKAFQQWLGSARPALSVHQMVHIAHNMEASVLNTPTGTQDYYPAVSGGINVLDYSVSGIEQKVLPIKNSLLEKNFLLVHTGKAHHSGLNNFEVMKAAVEKDDKVLTALRKLREVSEKTVQVCEAGDFEQLPRLFQQEFKARIELAPAFSSPEIEKLHGVSLQAGAEAVKICGAGGGGCVLVWVTPAQREKVIQACQKEGFQVLKAKPVDPVGL